MIVCGTTKSSSLPFSLADAMAARDLVKQGIDPKDRRDQDRRIKAEAEAAESPFGADADAWLLPNNKGWPRIAANS